MVRSPKEQVAEENREYMIPKTFEKYCSNNFQLKRINPLDQPRLNSAYVMTPLRPTYAIYDQEGEVVAEFHPNGYAHCKADTFRPIFEKMVDDIEKAAKRVIQKYNEYENLDTSKKKN